MNARIHRAGVTLIELIIVVAMLAMVVILAIPGYQHYKMKQYRQEVVEMLRDVASCQQVLLKQNGRFDPNQCITRVYSKDNSYKIHLEITDNGAGFRAVASPRGQQTRDRCGKLVLTERGQFSSSKIRNRGEVATCL